MNITPPSRFARYFGRPHRRALFSLGTMTVLYLSVASVLVPAGWRFHNRRHGLDDAPTRTRTADGIAGDPVNLALVGTETELVAGLVASGWRPADPITVRSSLRITRSTVFGGVYDTAPVSNLYLFGRRQDLAFEQPAGGNARRRHHVRFWRSPQADEDGRPVWLGAGTFDSSVGLSHTTGQVTHHIAALVDVERDKLIADLWAVGRLDGHEWVSGFHERLCGRNGGGDRYVTDGPL